MVNLSDKIQDTETFNEIIVFISYRDDDGLWHAEAVNRILSDSRFVDAAGTEHKVRVYFDKTAPGSEDWRLVHFDYLQASRALVVIATPGLASERPHNKYGDVAYAELRWWTKNRRQAPIIVDAVGKHEDRWLPALVRDKWPHINRISFPRKESWGNDVPREDQERLRERILATISISQHLVALQDVKRLQESVRRFTIAAVVSGLLFVATLLAVGMATAAASRARASEAVAVQKTQDLFSLSASQELARLERRAVELWPPASKLIPAYDRWLIDAGALMNGQSRDAGAGKPGKPGLATYEEYLMAVRSRARQATTEELAADERSHDLRDELSQVQAEMLWLKRMLGNEEWPDEAFVAKQLDSENHSQIPDELNREILPWVDLDATAVVFGHETEACVLAKKLVGMADDQGRPLVMDTLAWALFRTGRFDAALRQEAAAVADASDTQRTHLLARQSILRQQVDTWTSLAGHEQQVARLATLEKKSASIESAISLSVAYQFDDSKDAWWHEQLNGLVTALHDFGDPVSGLRGDGISPRHGWGIRKRREMARNVLEIQSTSGAKQAWAEAIATASGATYSGLSLRVQEDLLPLGVDPASGLLEFVDLLTGEPPFRDPTGQLVISESSGLVFVLLPQESFRMGAQRDDQSASNYDEGANANERPVYSVTLEPFFISKYEMTQAQWVRCTGANPSTHLPGERWGNAVVSLKNPVEQVSWSDCVIVLQRLGLRLPTEAQWECAARGGTVAPWWTGTNPESIAGAANIADGYFRDNGGPSTLQYEAWLNDGSSVHCAVDASRPNAFGLYSVMGNVWEWVSDRYGSYVLPTRLGDGARLMTRSQTRIFRGGGWVTLASACRMANRYGNSPDTRNDGLGLRPSRALAP